MATSSRSLRVGIVISGQLVEERVFPAASAVTFGQSLRCDLSVPVEGLPREHMLFDATGAFHPPAGAEVLGTGSRGKLTLGDVTLLFQDVATPAPMPRMQLPASLRNSLADRVDRRLAVIIGASLLGHLAIAGYAWTHDEVMHDFGARYVSPHYEEISITMPDLVAPPAISEPANTAGATAPARSAQTARPIVQRPTAIATQQLVDTQRLASILTGADGAIGKGGMSSRQTTAELAKQIADAQDSNAKIGDGTTTSRVDDHARVATTDRNLTDDPTLTTSPRPTRDEPTGRVIPGPVKQDQPTTLTPQVVLDRISTLYMAGLQRCYRFGLAEDATLAGKVALSFTVDERGHVIDPDASGVSSTVDGCISKQMRGWRFPIPKDKSGTSTDASFSVSLALQPS